MRRLVVLAIAVLAPTLSWAQGPPRLRIALALGGGAAKGIAHVGVLAWLEERDGRLLADGGVLNNVPVDVARDMGADVVIAVRVSSLPPEVPETILGLGLHAIDVMMEALTEPRLKDADLVIEPDLEGFTGTDYRKSAQLVKLGYDAAEAQAESLLPLALDEAAWPAYLAARRARTRTLPGQINFYEVRGVEEKGEATRLARLLDLQVGPELDEERLASTLSRIVGTNRYAAAAYGLAQHGEEIGLAVSVREKRHAPPFVNFFTELTNRGEDIDFNLGARATFLDLTSYGSELRVDGGLGSAMGLGGELFQPVGGRGLFAAVRGSHFRINENLYGPPAEAPSGREQVLRALAVADTRDAAYFPRTGLRLDASMDWYLEAAGTEESFGRLNASLGIPFPVGTWNRGLVRAEADTLGLTGGRADRLSCRTWIEPPPWHPRPFAP